MFSKRKCDDSELELVSCFAVVAFGEDFAVTKERPVGKPFRWSLFVLPRADRRQRACEGPNGYRESSAGELVPVKKQSEYVQNDLLAKDRETA